MTHVAADDGSPPHFQLPGARNLIAAIVVGVRGLFVAAAVAPQNG